MAVPTSFAQSNIVFERPPGEEYADVEPIAAFRGVSDDFPQVVTCWKLTQEELEEIIRTKRVWLVNAGTTMPPIRVTGVDPFRKDGESCADGSPTPS